MTHRNCAFSLPRLLADERHHEYLTRKGANCPPVLPSAWLPEHAGTMDVVVDSVCLDNYESTCRALSPEGVLVCSGQSAVWSHGDGKSGSRAAQTTMLKLWAKYMPKPRAVVYYDREESRKDIVRTDVSFIRPKRPFPHVNSVSEVISSPIPFSMVRNPSSTSASSRRRKR